MAHIYQPVMLMELLKNEGKASVEEIAQAILNRDPSQIEYYTQIVKRMVGDVLTNKRKITTKDKGFYSLAGVESLTHGEIDELISLCEQKIIDYEKKRDGAQWSHRRRGRRAVSGSIRYEVLKRASGRCELCGISNEFKNIEVDHITPKSLGGKDDISNYQALCYTCNAQKNNKDDTDFRKLNAMYEDRLHGCLFCDVQTIDRTRIVEENELAFVIRDGFPVTEHHSLFIPKRHVLDYFGLSQPELNAIHQLLHSQKELLLKLDPNIDGFNIGMNCGETAGQSVWHCHVHLIPRRKGDVEYPKGGVRHVIPYKGNYEDLK
ncbi:HIT domain-containing protein [Polynucleobacter kasalickyi]|nr:HIT domain-containing protein [Polynucleobacter kasalickyi]